MQKPRHKIIDVKDENLDKFDLFCQKSHTKDNGYKKKKKWFMKRYKEGLRIKLLMIDEGTRGFRSRGFIEYMPGEKSWRGVDAKGWFVIHCIWVVGKNKKFGLGSKLLRTCIADAKGRDGVVVVTSRKNWLPDERLFIKHGFEKVDERASFKLYALRLKSAVKNPRFYPISEKKKKSYGRGLTVFVSDQCPYIHNSMIGIQRLAEQAKIPLRIQHIENHDELKKHCVHPYGVFCVLLDGNVISYYPGGSLHEIKQAVTLQ
jgi:L-amino acid N-acyltransferase YncA